MTQITQFLRRAVQTNGGDIATVCGERTQSWHQFADRVARLAGALQKLGMQAGRPRRASWRSTPTATSNTCLPCPGAAACSCRSTPGWRPPEILYSGWTIPAAPSCWSTTRSVPVLPSSSRPELADAARGRSISATGRLPAGMLAYETPAGRRRRRRRRRRGGDDLAGIFYTGGTTGRSKGVMLSHRNIVRQRAEHASPRSLVDADTRLYARRADVPPRRRRDDASRDGASAARTASCRASIRLALMQADRSATGSPTCCWCRP